MKRSRSMKGNKSYKRYRIRPFDVCNVLILGAFALLCMYPFYYLIIYSCLLYTSSEPMRRGEKGPLCVFVSQRRWGSGSLTPL